MTTASTPSPSLRFLQNNMDADLDKLPSDFFVTVNQFTNTVYRDVYPSIDPSSPALSQAGKVVIISGASKGIGKRVRHTFLSPRTLLDQYGHVSKWLYMTITLFIGLCSIFCPFEACRHSLSRAFRCAACGDRSLDTNRHHLSSPYRHHSAVICCESIRADQAKVPTRRSSIDQQCRFLQRTKPDCLRRR